MNKLLLLLLITLFSVNLSYSSGTCIDAQILSKVVFSLNDNSFSSYYDGNSGIIQEINYSGGEYYLWQTPLLTSLSGANYHFDPIWNPSLNYPTHSSYDTNSILEIPISSNSFDLYVKVTSRFIGDCSSTTGEIKINTDTDIRYYGSTQYNSQKSVNIRSPSSYSTSSISVVPGDEFENIFRISDSSISFNGRLSMLLGPRNHQKLRYYFMLEGNNSLCGDGMLGYSQFYNRQEICDTALESNCEAQCDYKIPVCGNSIVESGTQYNPREVCDITGNPQCNACTSITSICGNGVVESGTQYTSQEVCDITGNPQCNACTSITPICGNGVVESGTQYTSQEQCDDGNTVNIDGCSSTCQLEAQDPIVVWDNYFNPDEMFLGNNITPGQNMTLRYNVSNPNSESINITFEHRFTTEHWSKTHSDKTYHYFEFYVSPWQKPASIQSESFVIPAQTNATITRIISIPSGFSQDELISTYSIFLEEFISYTTFTSVLPPTFIKAQNGLYGVGGESNRRNVATDAGEKKNLGYHGNVGSFYPMAILMDLTPQSTTFLQTTNEDGIPSIGILFDSGKVHSNWQESIPKGTFFLNTYLEVYDGGSWKKTHEQNYTVPEFVSASNSWPIHQNIYNYRGVPALENGSIIGPLYEQQISFPIIDFEQFDQKDIRITAIPYNNITNTPIHSTNIHTSISKEFNLNSIFIAIDRPIEIYPNGANGFNNVSTRMIIFNEEDFSLFNVNLSLSLVGSTFDKGDISIDFPKNLLVPAGSAFPIPIEVFYNGPSSTSVLQDTLKINTSFIEPISGDVINRETYIQIIVYPDLVTSDFVDLLPSKLDFSLLNLDEVSNINFSIKNQGGLYSGPFDVDIYYKYKNETNFTHLNTFNSLGLGAKEEENFDLSFTPSKLEKVTLKVVVDEDNNIFEDDTYIKGAKSNNILTVTASVRNIDVFLENVIIDYENANNSIIPIKIFASNKGSGGIDAYEMILTIQNDKNTYIKSSTFTQIPEEGKEVIYYLNVSNMDPGSYNFKVDLVAPFDPDLSDNTFESTLDFCPTPWYNGPLSCNTYCTNSCLNPFTNRYLATCHSINGCYFKSPYFAESCDSLKKDSYASFLNPDGSINLTHEAQCHEGIKIVEKKYTDDDLIIEGDCSEIIVNKYPGIFDNLDVLVNFVVCRE